MGKDEKFLKKESKFKELYNFGKAIIRSNPNLLSNMPLLKNDFLELKIEKLNLFETYNTFNNSFIKGELTNVKEDNYFTLKEEAEQEFYIEFFSFEVGKEKILELEKDILINYKKMLNGELNFEFRNFIIDNIEDEILKKELLD